ncbi:G-protein-coupled receptor [Dictyostelium discoideum AX4]|uniref:Cyclic AMP receptor 4 n=1 Tax=Dictyostelium discoideum TaxID=44689 RepID=CAR4_DICDI|nr:G-protein-coupled receptor [Dictyostelium discoideum AX4]Q9TX43.2 RecName: Full=Cyclic AMP receptor 4; Short=cAMP receptor 4 [Dictyostelium discoideum]EAL68088.1 G-protein-coupled receptor [Dictyostelium discoideum AX4]|eukprot:XP_642216.1 G-protein-coupled receptor [Dictyostelium discoideum AX4]
MKVLQEINLTYSILVIADFSSIFGCLLVLIAFKKLKLLRNHITRVIACFCVSSLLKDIISTGLTLSLGPQNEAGSTSFQCYLYAITITYGSLACWLWTLCLAFSIYNLIVKREPEPEKYEKFYHGVCWTIPLICVIVMLAKKTIEPVGNWCWISEKYVGYRFGLFYGPFFAIWIISAVLVGLTSRYTYSVIRNSVSDNKDKHMTYQFKLINYIIVFLLCWVFAIVNRILNGLGYYPTLPNILHTYFSVSHGFFASVTFIYNNPLMWRYWGSKIFLIFAKFGYFVELQRRLDRNKNNNNPSPILNSYAATVYHSSTIESLSLQHNNDISNDNQQQQQQQQTPQQPQQQFQQQQSPTVIEMQNLKQDQNIENNEQNENCYNTIDTNIEINTNKLNDNSFEITQPSNDLNTIENNNNYNNNNNNNNNNSLVIEKEKDEREKKDNKF